MNRINHKGKTLTIIGALVFIVAMILLIVAFYLTGTIEIVANSIYCVSMFSVV